MFPSGYSKSSLAEVEVVEPERLLEDGRVLLAREREHGLAVVEHVVAPDLVGAVGEAVRVLVARRREQQLGRVGRAAGDDDDVAGEASPSSPSCSTTTSVTAVPAAFVSSLTALALVSSVTFGCSSAGRTPSTSASDLACTDAGEAVAVGAAHARAVRHVRLVEHDAARRVERVVAGGGEVVGELLDARLVRDRRVRVRRARRRLGRVLAAGAVHLVELLGLRVVRLQLVVGDRPGGRDAVVVAELAEVLLAQPVERRAVELRRAADEVVDLRLERLAASRRTRCPARRSGCRRRRPAASQFCGSRGSQSPRSSSRMRLPEGARWRASVPPPAPVPMMMTS